MVTFKYLYVPGQGSPPKTLFKTVILQFRFPSHTLLTIVSDVVDRHSTVFIFVEEHTLLPSVRPKMASTILMFPAAQSSFISSPSQAVLLTTFEKKKPDLDLTKTQNSTLF